MQRVLTRITATVLLMASTLLWGTARAQNNCSSPGNSFEDVYCLTKIFVNADNDLNTTYQKLLGKLSPTAQATLRQTQRRWVTRRNSECTARDSKQGAVIYMDCAVDMTVARSNVLNDRYRECVSSGCQPAKLN